MLLVVCWEDKYTHLRKWVQKPPNESYFREQGSSRDFSDLKELEEISPLKSKLVKKGK